MASAMNIFIFTLIFQQILTVLCQETTIVPTVTDIIDSETTNVSESVTTMGSVSFIENTTIVENNNPTVENETITNTESKIQKLDESSTSSESIESPKALEESTISKFETGNIETVQPDENIEIKGISKTGEMGKIEEESKPNETEKTTEIETPIENAKLNETLEKQNETIATEVRVDKNAISEENPPAMVENPEIQNEDEMQNDEAAVDSTNTVNDQASSLSTSAVQDVKSSTDDVISSSASTSTASPTANESTTKGESSSGMTSILISTVSKTTDSSVIYKITSGTLPSKSSTISPQEFNGNKKSKNSANSLSSSLVSALLLLGNVYYIGLYF